MLEHERAANRANWDDRVAAHLASPDYGVAGFVSNAGEISRAVEMDRHELGDVRGRSLLHLQCHIGLDTLSWARLGAIATGIDFSERSIEAARDISHRSGTPGRFILTDVHEAPEVLDETFDIVYASEGALVWLPDVTAWARVVRRFTRPGGVAYIRDGHPIFGTLDHDRSDGRLELAGSYFEDDAVRIDEPGTYVKTDVDIGHTVTFEWNHGLGETVTALSDEGFRIEALKEFAFGAYRALPGMVEDDDGWWHLRDRPERLPLMFSVRATLKPDEKPA